MEISKTTKKHIESIIERLSQFSSSTSDIDAYFEYLDNELKKKIDRPAVLNGPTEFNQDISRWDVSEVTDMKKMFTTKPNK